MSTPASADVTEVHCRSLVLRYRNRLLSGLLRREARRVVQLRRWNATLTKAVADWQQLWNEKEKWEKAAKDAWAREAAVSRLSGGNTPADAATASLHELASDFRQRAEQTSLAYDEEEAPEDECDSRAECHASARYLTWKLAARALEKLISEAGWGSAVATPADTQADDLPRFCHEANGNYEHSTPVRIKEWLEHRKLSTEGTKAELVARLRADDAHPAHQCGCCPRVARSRCEPWCPRSLVWLSRDPAPSVGADPEDEVREDAEDREVADAIRVAPGTGCVLIDLVPEWNPGDKAVWRIDDDAPGEPVEIVKVVGTTAFVASGNHRYTVDTAELSPPAAVADTAHERTKPDA